MKIRYEGVVGTYSFIMNENDVIEVWGDSDNENPESFIFLKKGEVNSQKDFEKEISFWYLKNVS